MPERQSNQIARILAVAGLVVLFLLVVITVATSGGGDSDNGGGGDDNAQVDSKGPTATGKQAVDAGVWIVHEGDTLTQISEQTGIEIDDLVDLNPDVDPQALISGQRIALR